MPARAPTNPHSIARWPLTQEPIDRRSLDLHLGPLGAQVDPDSGVFTAPNAEWYGQNSYDRPYFDDKNPADRMQGVGFNVSDIAEFLLRHRNRR